MIEHINKYIRTLNFKFLIVLTIIMGISAGFEFLSKAVPLKIKLLFTFYGLLIGLILGFFLVFLINNWQVDSKKKRLTILIYILFTIAPIIWCILDLPENSKSNIGLFSMLMINLFAIFMLLKVFKGTHKKLIPNLFIIPVWQMISLYWFMSLTWKFMGYWD